MYVTVAPVAPLGGRIGLSNPSKVTGLLPSANMFGSAPGSVIVIESRVRLLLLVAPMVTVLFDPAAIVFGSKLLLASREMSLDSIV